jgi:hypothetical protein
MYVHERLASEMGEYHAAFGTLTRCSDTQTSCEFLPPSSRADAPFERLDNCPLTTT